MIFGWFRHWNPFLHGEILHFGEIPPGCCAVHCSTSDLGERGAAAKGRRGIFHPCWSLGFTMKTWWNLGILSCYPLVMSKHPIESHWIPLNLHFLPEGTLWLCQNSELEHGPVEIVDFPIRKNSDFLSSSFCKRLPGRVIWVLSSWKFDGDPTGTFAFWERCPIPKPLHFSVAFKGKRVSLYHLLVHFAIHFYIYIYIFGKTHSHVVHMLGYMQRILCGWW